MDVELLEIRDFLAEQAPFSLLAPEQLDTLPKQLAIRYLRRGSPFPPEEVEKDCLYLLRQGAIEIRGEHRELIDKYGEGDVYSARCSASNPERDYHGQAVEDSLLYLLPCQTINDLRDGNSAFSEQLDDSVRVRLKRPLSTIHQQQLGENRLMQTSVWELIRREPVTATSDTSIADAARHMTGQRVSALLIVDDGRLKGILTDRDLRSRCIAAGIAVSRPVSEIMSTDLETVSSEAQVFEALLHMTRLNVHHMPVVDYDRIHGLVTHSDILQMERSHAIYLAAEIERAQTPQQLAVIAGRLPELQVQLIEQGNSAQQLGQVLSAIVDAITIRLLQMAEDKFGKAPVRYCWFVMGSLARREPTITSDQDNALILAEGYDEQQHANYFSQLASFVSQGLHQCGIGYCPGGMMAATGEWRKTLNGWRQAFNEWFRHPGEKEVMLACNFLDLRAVAGDKALLHRLMQSVLPEADRHEAFITALAMNALQHHTPLGFFRNLVLSDDERHKDELDLKAGGLMPIVSLARYYAVQAGIDEMNTAARIEAAHQAGLLSEEGAAELLDAYHFIATLRARHQVRQINHGETASQYIDPQGLSVMERRHLKDAFKMVRRQQAALQQRFQLSGTQ
jgi:CBS domain-containing protein